MLTYADGIGAGGDDRRLQQTRLGHLPLYTLDARGRAGREPAGMLLLHAALSF
jgi:hypothetical protein